MKRSEEINLSHQLEAIKNFAKRHSDFDSFYQRIDVLAMTSIQDLSFEKDIDFFSELRFILSVVLSIIAKPHLNNRRDEIIARSGEVSNLSQEDFQKTLRDSSIWKDDGHRILLPEYVYYHQYEDELKIYENIFIVSLINEISFIIDHYSALYISLLNVASMHQKTLLMDESMQEKAMDAVNYLSHRINQIKETFFYREVNKAKNKPRVYYPTNILLKDRLYNICFKFYRKLHVYESGEELTDSLFIYYYVLFLINLKNMGYILDTRSNKYLVYEDKKIVIPEKINLIHEDVRITLTTNEKDKSFILNYKDKLDESSSSHKLYINSDPTFQDVAIKKKEECFTTEYLSTWHLGLLKDKKIQLLNETLSTENEMVTTFIESHHLVISGSEKIYSSYCPSCKNKGVDNKDGYYRCTECGAIYKFMKVKGNGKSNRIIFARLGYRR